MKKANGAMGLKALGLALSLTASAASQAFDQMFVFGDSLSDIGNDLLLTTELKQQGLSPIEIPPRTRYYKGRFSNGPVWVEHLAERIGVRGRDLLPSRYPTADASVHSLVYAYGGSGTTATNLTPGGFPVDGLLGQVTEFAALGAADPDALYVIWSGANDYLLGGMVEGLPPLDLSANPADPTVGNTLAAIQSLHAVGARHFLILNLPDLGNVPATAALDETSRAGLSLITEVHNATLAGRLQGLAHSGALDAQATLDLVDVFSLMAQIGDAPSALGFSGDFTQAGPAAGCLVFAELGPDCSPLSGGLDADGAPFWDEQHPSSELHRLIAFRAAFCLNDAGSCRVE